MCKYPFQSPNNPGDPVDDLAFTMFVLDQEGFFDDTDNGLVGYDLDDDDLFNEYNQDEDW